MKVATCSWTMGIAELPCMMAKVKELSLDGLQFCGDYRQYAASDVKAAAKSHGVELLALDPLNCKPLNPSEATESEALRFWCAMVDYAVELGGVPLTLQGVSTWTVGCTTRADKLAMLARCLRGIARHAKPRGIRLLYEVVNRYEVPLIHTVQECQELLGRVGDTDIGILLDAFHMHIEEADPLQAIRVAGPQLASYHISDSNRGGIGEAQVDFAAQRRLLQDLKFEGFAVLELVLRHLAPSTAPSTPEDRHAWDEKMRHSVRLWREMEKAASEGHR